MPSIGRAISKGVAPFGVDPISNPVGLRNQSTGGILQGMSRMAEVTWNDNRITSTDWEGFRTLHLGIEIPRFALVLPNSTSVLATGVG
jgi:hypothetical protein